MGGVKEEKVMMETENEEERLVVERQVMACIVSKNSNVRKNTLTQVSPSKNTPIQLAAMKEYTTMLLESYKNVPQNIAPSAHILRIIFVHSLDFLRPILRSCCGRYMPFIYYLSSIICHHTPIIYTNIGDST